MKIFNNINKKEQLEFQKNCHSSNEKINITISKSFIRKYDIQLLLEKSKIPIKSVLCLGCRDYSEVQDFILNKINAVGIDISSTDKRIISGDAHCLTRYVKGPFDAIYCSHSLEHMHTVRSVLFEIKQLNPKYVFVVLPLSGKLKMQHPTIFEIMTTKDRDIFNKSEHKKIWDDFLEIEPFDILYGGFRDNSKESVPQSIEPEVYFMVELK